MKKILVVGFLLLIFVLHTKCSNKVKKKNTPPNNAKKYCTVTWVDDIHKYATDNNLIFSGVREGEAEKGLNYYTLGTYSRYSFAEIFDEPFIAIKETKGYKILKLDTSNIGLSSSISIIGTTTLNNNEVLEVISTFETAWSMASPIAGAHHECNKTLILVNIETNEVLFSKMFKRHYENTHEYDNYDMDSLYRHLYPEDIFEKDTAEKVSTFEWLNYHYLVKNNRVEFYKINEDPTGECNSYSLEQEKEIIAKYVTGKQPEFYYEYNVKKNVWIKNE